MLLTEAGDGVVVGMFSTVNFLLPNQMLLGANKAHDCLGYLHPYSALPPSSLWRAGEPSFTRTLEPIMLRRGLSVVIGFVFYNWENEH